MRPDTAPSEPGGETIGRSDLLSLLVQTLPERLPPQVTLGSLLAALGDQATAMILIVFAIPAIIPTPGIPAGMIFGTALALLSLQLILGAPHFSLPGFMARITVPRVVIEASSAWAGRRLRQFEGLLRPRAVHLADNGARRLLGVVVLAMAVLIALPIPFGNVIPGLSILLIAMGMAQRDGLAVGAGFALGLLALAFSVAIVYGSWWLISEWLGFGISGTAA